MEISVSRLNNRMALQVPAELPLGLVFIVGEVRNLTPAGRSGYSHFDLVEVGYHLRCRLPQQVAEEVMLEEGNRVRVGGQLAFEPSWAHYYLLARDVDVIPKKSPGRGAMGPILEDIKKRSESASLARAELPPWVEKLAPPEVRAELGLEAPGAEEAAEEEGVRSKPQALPEQTQPALPAGELSDDMVTFLSDAIDSEEEVELTPDMLARFQASQAQQKEELPAATEEGEGDAPAAPGETETDPAFASIADEQAMAEVEAPAPPAEEPSAALPPAAPTEREEPPREAPSPAGQDVAQPRWQSWLQILLVTLLVLLCVVAIALTVIILAS